MYVPGGFQFNEQLEDIVSAWGFPAYGNSRLGMHAAIIKLPCSLVVNRAIQPAHLPVCATRDPEFARVAVSTVSDGRWTQTRAGGGRTTGNRRLGGGQAT